MPDALTPSRRDLWLHWLVYPGHSLPTAAAPVLVAMALALHDHVFAIVPAAMAFIASWFIHIGGLFTDNYQLVVRHPTVREHPELLDALKSGTLTLNAMRAAIVACFALSALTGPYFLDVAGSPVIAIGLLGMTGSLIYSSGPFPFGKLGISDLQFFVMFGIFAPAAAYYVQLASHYEAFSGWHIVLRDIPLHAFVVGLPIGALAVNVLIIDDVRDRHFDAAKGWRTGPVRFGVGWSRIEYSLLSAFAYVIPFWFWLRWDFDMWVLLPLLTLPFASALSRTIWTVDDPHALTPMTPMAAMLCFAYSALLAVGIAL